MSASPKSGPLGKLLRKSLRLTPPRGKDKSKGDKKSKRLSRSSGPTTATATEELPFKFPLALADCVAPGAPTTEAGNPRELFSFSESVLRTLEHYGVEPESLRSAELVQLACYAMRFLGLARFAFDDASEAAGLQALDEQAFLARYSDYLGQCKLGDCLGGGTFGDVYLARAPDGRDVAVKFMEHVRPSRKLRNVKEGWLLSRLSHANIVRFHACGVTEMAFRTPDKVPLFWIATEYLQGDTLHAARQSDAQLREPHLAYIAAHTLGALQSLHKHHIVHLDLKSENVMLTGSGRIKLIDFGLAEDVAVPKLAGAGSPYSMAPEIIRRQPVQTAPDVWSLGMLLIELAHGVSMADLLGSALAVMIRHGSVGVDPELNFRRPPRFTFSQSFRSFLLACLTFDQASRPTAAELAAHPWLSVQCDRQMIRDAVDCLFVQQTFKHLGIGL